MRSARPWVAALALPLLSGCVAAAIPVLAAGGLAKSQSDRGEAPASGQPRVALPADPPRAALTVPNDTAPAAVVRDYTLTDGTKVTVTNTLSAMPRPAASIAQEVADVAETPLPKAVLLAGVTALPEPLAPAPRPSSSSLGTGYAEFTAFATERAAIPVAGSERRSAMLADSRQLDPTTKDCSIHPSAILIDLDPAGDALDTARPLAADATFAASLAELRREGVEIGWVSGRTADRAGAIRKALAGAGLDPDGRDQLVLLRFPEERKQTRREDFAKSHCVLAIAGDERADFDELFAYLRDPAAATPLDTLIGKGWFLVPPPLD